MDGNVINTQKIDELLDSIFPDGENKEIVHNNVHQCAKDGTLIGQMITWLFTPVPVVSHVSILSYLAADDDQCLVAQNFAQCGLEHLKLTARQLLSTIA